MCEKISAFGQGRGIGRGVGSWLALALLTNCIFALTACSHNHAQVEPSTPEDPTVKTPAEAAAGAPDESGGDTSEESAAEIMLPRKIEIQRHWTKPFRLGKKRGADGMEVFIAACDACGDSTKMVGTLHIELYTRRPASSDKLGERLAFWCIELNTPEQITAQWDPLARFYRFPLKLVSSPLPPGRYVLTATLQPPCGDRLMDEFCFEHELAQTEKKSPSKGTSQKP